MKAKIGIDVGNYDTKTQNTTTPSSYTGYTTKPLLVDEVLFYDGMYYTPTKDRNNQQIDKTKDGYCLIMSLFGIAKELIFQVRRNNEEEFKNLTEKEAEEILQSHIHEINEISIGVGLPIGYFSSNSSSLKETYLNAWKGGVNFVYNNIDFSLKLTGCSVLSQDYTAVAFNKTIEIANDFTDYLIFGIGGGTADCIPILDTTPQTNKCVTLQKGTTVMYSQIIQKIQHETGHTMDANAVEKVLKGGNTIVSDDIQQRIRELAKEFADKLVDDFIHQGLDLKSYPSVFIGGGALMLKDALETNKNFAKMQIVDDVRANAKYFAMFAPD